MKVIHRSDTLLVLEDRPWFIGLLMILMALCFLYGGMALFGEGKSLGGLFMAVLGGGVPVLLAAWLVRRVRLTFDRATGQLTRTMRSVRGFSQQSYPLDRITGAKVAVNFDSDGNTYRTELQLTDPSETVPFTTYYTNGPKPEAMAQTVNDWLTAPK